MALTLRSQVAFTLNAVDLRPYPGSIQPSYELFRIGTDFVAVLQIAVLCMVFFRLIRGLYLSTYDWLIVGWAADWQMICEAVRLMVAPGGLSYGAISQA